MNTTFANRSLSAYMLVCSGCGAPVETALPTFAHCDSCGPSPILIRHSSEERCQSAIDTNERSMWRYRAFLPMTESEFPISLGEGWTPMLALGKLARELCMEGLYLKDESFNPTGSFKARGLSMAITKAKSAGISGCIIPTAGNAGGAAAAYCAKAGIEAVVVMPAHTPEVFRKECELFGAEVVLVDGLISDCARRAQALRKTRDLFDLSTMKEPYRLEGKKTLGYEIAEQGGWTLPDVILYPTGGGTGLIGIWKAFREMQAFGWISSRLPRMIAVQSAACQPLAQTWQGHQENASCYTGSATMANGLAVPNPFAEKLMLQVLHQSNGTVVTVSDADIRKSWKELASREGLLVAPEGAALLSALRQLLSNGTIDESATVLLLNTGSGHKYLEHWRAADGLTG